ncbi:hypothetical protein, partial [Akkermansia sp.]|uniref:hypothetical protein n=1 Tax=Akkermansia sp. TaxID=1872421 RepID=UPI003AB78972
FSVAYFFFKNQRKELPGNSCLQWQENKIRIALFSQSHFIRGILFLFRFMVHVPAEKSIPLLFRISVK